jgi:hypothetical protein
MQIDETREEGVTIELHTPGARESGVRFAQRQYGPDAPPRDDDGMIPEHRVCRRYRQDPSGLNESDWLGQ